MACEPLDRVGRTELHHAVIEQQIENVAALIRSRVDVDQADANSWTPLHFAAQNQAVDIARLLLKAGAEVNAQDKHGNTPLFTAVFNSRGKGQLIQLLREHNADPFLKNHHGVSPIELAKTIANYDVGQYFDDLSD